VLLRITSYTIKKFDSKKEIYFKVEKGEESVLESEIKLIFSSFEIGQNGCNMMVYTGEKKGRYG
jgi:hypothetical protein